jgi:uncharacterized damage-inducible protein DinB
MTILPPSNGEARPAIETLIMLIEVAFDSDPKHSLLANLHDLHAEEWTMLPAGGGRSVADIVEHVAWTKWIYEDHAFGPAALRWDEPPPVPAGAHSRPTAELLAWLTEGQRRWLAGVKSLAYDAELDRPRGVHWGGPIPTRTIIHITIAHDLYHAGEINHLRALLQGTDDWPGSSSMS